MYIFQMKWNIINITSVTFVKLSIVTSVTMGEMIYTLYKSRIYMIFPILGLYFVVTMLSEGRGRIPYQDIELFYIIQAYFVTDVMLCHGRDESKIC